MNMWDFIAGCFAGFFIGIVFSLVFLLGVEIEVYHKKRKERTFSG